jgi:hypothetical protein
MAHMEGELAHIYPLELFVKMMEIQVYIENMQHKDNHFVKESSGSLRDALESSQLFDAS